MWHYQMVRHRRADGDYFAIHERFRDHDGPGSDTITVEPVTVVGDSAEEVLETLLMMRVDARKRGVVDFDDFPGPLDGGGET